jgi:hypothetical protein
LSLSPLSSNLRKQVKRIQALICTFVYAWLRQRPSKLFLTRVSGVEMRFDAFQGVTARKEAYVVWIEREHKGSLTIF